MSTCSEENVSVCGYCGYQNGHTLQCFQMQALTGMTPRRMTPQQRAVYEDLLKKTQHVK